MLMFAQSNTREPALRKKSLAERANEELTAHRGFRRLGHSNSCQIRITVPIMPDSAIVMAREGVLAVGPRDRRGHKVRQAVPGQQSEPGIERCRACLRTVQLLTNSPGLLLRSSYTRSYREGQSPKSTRAVSGNGTSRSDLVRSSPSEEVPFCSRLHRLYGPF